MQGFSGFEHGVGRQNGPNVPYGERTWVTVDVANVAATASKCFGRSRINWGRFFAPIRDARWRHIELISSNKWISSRQRHYLEGTWGAEVWDADKNADALVGASLLLGARQAHRLVLCAGDDDYVDIVDFLKGQGLVVDVWSFKQCLAPSLAEICDGLRILGRDVLFPDSKRPSPGRPGAQFNPFVLAAPSRPSSVPALMLPKSE